MVQCSTCVPTKIVLWSLVYIIWLLYHYQFLLLSISDNEKVNPLSSMGRQWQAISWQPLLTWNTLHYILYCKLAVVSTMLQVNFYFTLCICSLSNIFILFECIFLKCLVAYVLYLYLPYWQGVMHAKCCLRGKFALLLGDS